MPARIRSIQATNTDAFIENLDKIPIPSSHKQIFISRYPQTSLIDRLDITEITCYWMTLSDGMGTIDPSLEKLNHLIMTTTSDGQGTIFMEGIEWLTSLHGFDAVHSMIRSLSEKVSMSDWYIYFAISGESFSQRDRSRLYREAPLLDLDALQENIKPVGLKDDFVNKPAQKSSVEIDLNDDGTPKLVLLTKLPRSGFTKQILQRRILQWRRMGLDTSDIESSLYSKDEEKMYIKYAEIEENIRRATELERYVISAVGDTQERTIALFRIRQLTGLDELEKIYFSD